MSMSDHQEPGSATPSEVESLGSAVVPVPRSVRGMLQAERVWDAWESRPSAQRDQYLEWIAAADQPSGNAERIDQMIAELRAGDRFMGETWGQ